MKPPYGTYETTPVISINGLSVTERNSKLYVKRTLFTDGVSAVLMCMVGIAAAIMRFNNVSFELILISGPVFIILIWQEFNTINILIIDLNSKTVLVKSRNPLVNILQLKNNLRRGYLFKEIFSIKIESNKSIRLKNQKFSLVFIFKDGKRKKIFSFKEEKSTFLLKKYLDSIILSSNA